MDGAAGINWGLVLGGVVAGGSALVSATGIVWKMATFTQAMHSLEAKVDSLVDCGKAEHAEFRKRLEDHHTRISILEDHCDTGNGKACNRK